MFLLMEKTFDALMVIMNKELETIVSWFSVNKLYLNIKKTHYVVYIVLYGSN